MITNQEAPTSLVTAFIIPFRLRTSRACAEILLA